MESTQMGAPESFPSSERVTLGRLPVCLAQWGFCAWLPTLFGKTQTHCPSECSSWAQNQTETSGYFSAVSSRYLRRIPHHWFSRMSLKNFPRRWSSSSDGMQVQHLNVLFISPRKWLKHFITLDVFYSVLTFLFLFRPVLRPLDNKTGSHYGCLRRSCWRSICMLVFLSVTESIVVLCHLFVVFAHTLVAFTHNSKQCWAKRNFLNAWSLQENIARSAACQCRYYCSHIINE